LLLFGSFLQGYGPVHHEISAALFADRPQRIGGRLVLASGIPSGLQRRNPPVPRISGMALRRTASWLASQFFIV
jgi:hypothetical protein